MSQSSVGPCFIASSAMANADAVPRSTSPSIPQRVKRGPRGGIYDPFPLKFHRMLDQIREEGQESVVSWLCHGRAFKIHKPKVFAASIMPRFFNQSKYTSFQRQLNLYGFSRCCRGRDVGAYHHPFFLRGKKALAKNIVRTKIKGNGHKTMRLHEAEPDFHSMASLPDDVTQDTDVSSVISNATPTSLEPHQPMMAASQAGFGISDSRSPPPSFSSDAVLTNNLRINNVSPSYSTNTFDLARQVSISEGESSGNFVNDLNQSIFIHELAMGCAILCQLKATDAAHL